MNLGIKLIADCVCKRGDDISYMTLGKRYIDVRLDEDFIKYSMCILGNIYYVPNLDLLKNDDNSTDLINIFANYVNNNTLKHKIILNIMVFIHTPINENLEFIPNVVSSFTIDPNMTSKITHVNISKFYHDYIYRIIGHSKHIANKFILSFADKLLILNCAIYLGYSNYIPIDVLHTIKQDMLYISLLNSFCMKNIGIITLLDKYVDDPNYDECLLKAIKNMSTVGVIYLKNKATNFLDCINMLINDSAYGYKYAEVTLTMCNILIDQKLLNDDDIENINKYIKNIESQKHSTIIDYDIQNNNFYTSQKNY